MLAPCISALLATAAASDPLPAARALLERVLPESHAQFELQVLPAKDGSAMQLDTDGKKVVLRGTDGVALASALNWYLNDYLNATMDWNTYAEGQLPEGPLPLPLPSTASAVVRRQLPWSYYMNVCTYGYSLAFVPWEYWEKHIDWMAMNGVNMPLGFVGQEHLWVKTFQQFGLSADEQRSFYSGPAFLPWFRMGNMRGFGGPLSDEWIEARRRLALQVLGRMRGLGMTPALGAFAGHVPKAFAAKFPHANVSRSPDWAGFDTGDPATAPFADVYLLEPTDPMFQKVGAAFIEVQAQEYGTDHIYQTDTYNEMQPPTADPAYLRRSAAAVYAAMAKGDAHAVWLMQGWLFQNSRFWQAEQIEAYLGGVPRGKMWLLDLFGDSNPIWSKTASYYGHPFIFCTLLNFGGQQGMTGNTPQLLAHFDAAQANASSLAGVGITMEGIWTNYAVFEMTLQLGWGGQPSGRDEWWRRFGARRYGGAGDPSAVAAWELLGRTVYAGAGNDHAGFGSAISARPSLQGKACPPPRSPAPAAPPGYHRRPLRDGYWTPPPAARTNTSVGECARLCDADAACKAFEVYVHYPPDRGDCYPFDSTAGTFVTLGGGSRTYLKDSATAAAVDAARPQRAAAERARARAFAEAWGLLLGAAEAVGAAAYRFDLVDVGREVLALNFSATLAQYEQARRLQWPATHSGPPPTLFTRVHHARAFQLVDLPHVAGLRCGQRECACGARRSAARRHRRLRGAPRDRFELPVGALDPVG